MKIQVLENLFADLRDHGENLNGKLIASEEKTINLESVIAELKITNRNQLN